MRKHELTPQCHDYFEYFGNTEIERIRQRTGRVLRRDWIILDSVGDAMDFFNSKCGEFVSYYT